MVSTYQWRGMETKPSCSFDGWYLEVPVKTRALSCCPHVEVVRNQIRCDILHTNKAQWSCRRWCPSVDVIVNLTSPIVPTQRVLHPDGKQNAKAFLNPHGTRTLTISELPYIVVAALWSYIYLRGSCRTLWAASRTTAHAVLTCRDPMAKAFLIVTRLARRANRMFGHLSD